MRRLVDIRIRNITVSRAVASIMVAILAGALGATLAKLCCGMPLLELVGYFGGALLGLRLQAWWLNRSDNRTADGE